MDDIVRRPVWRAKIVQIRVKVLEMLNGLREKDKDTERAQAAAIARVLQDLLAKDKEQGRIPYSQTAEQMLRAIVALIESDTPHRHNLLIKNNMEQAVRELQEEFDIDLAA